MWRKERSVSGLKARGHSTKARRVLASGFKYPRQTRRLGYLGADIASSLSRCYSPSFDLRRLIALHYTKQNHKLHYDGEWGGAA